MTDLHQKLLLADSLDDGTTTGRKPLFDRFGGRPFLDRLHKLFYDKVYADPWMSNFFAGIPQEHIENQQSDFIAQLTGGPKRFYGRMPVDAHVHIMVTEELFNHRHELLKDSLVEIGTPAQELSELLKIDLAFKRVLVKQNLDECKRRYTMDEILVFPNPNSKPSSSAA